MKILNDMEREHILRTLANAPDDILINAVHEMKRQTLDVQNGMKEINGFVGIHPTEPPKGNFTPAVPEPAAEAKPKVEEPTNTVPPGSASARITTASKDAILVKLTKPSTLEEVNKFLSRGPGKLTETQALLRLMWDRGFIQFDGERYRRAS